jgi:signal peptidase I
MADTLMGAHFRLRCSQCGYRYDHGFVPERYGYTQDTIPRGSVKPILSRCPSCGHYQSVGGTMPIASGDRVLVLKCIYQFFQPKQWDVVVFKSPTDPRTNFIKRLIGRPGETVEIINGDIYINGQISRKPLKVQNELWMPIFDNDYQPVNPNEPSFNGHAWQQPFKNVGDSKWRLAKDMPSLFTLDCPAEQTNSLVYDTSVGNKFRAAHAYDDIREYSYMPYCSDLMVRFYAHTTGEDGHIGIGLSKYETYYSAWVDMKGEMVIEKTFKGEQTILARKPIKPNIYNEPAMVKFANVDHQLIFQVGAEKLVYDLGRGPNDAGQRMSDIEPQVKIFGSGKLTLSHIAIFRDIQYTESKFVNSHEIGRAIEGNPLTLENDEFFVMGDNSPNSDDGRWWSEQGKGNNSQFYRAGIVPRNYLVGKALFVYWPSCFQPFGKSSFVFVPNLGRLRFIYGGSSKKL